MNDNNLIYIKRKYIMYWLNKWVTIFSGPIHSVPIPIYYTINTSHPTNTIPSPPPFFNTNVDSPRVDDMYVLLLHNCIASAEEVNWLANHDQGYTANPRDMIFQELPQVAFAATWWWWCKLSLSAGEVGRWNFFGGWNGRRRRRRQSMALEEEDNPLAWISYMAFEI